MSEQSSPLFFSSPLIFMMCLSLEPYIKSKWKKIFQNFKSSLLYVLVTIFVLWLTLWPCGWIHIRTRYITNTKDIEKKYIFEAVIFKKHLKDSTLQAKTPKIMLIKTQVLANLFCPLADNQSKIACFRETSVILFWNSIFAIG